MIQCKNLTKRFGNKVAVDTLDLTVQPGKITGFIGPNGAGKTTTLKMMCGILRPDAGTCLLNDIDIQTDDIHAKRQFGFVADSPDSFLQLKGIEYINFVADMYDVDSEVRQQRIEQLTKEFKMDDVLHNKLSTYSHGMRQKIMMIAVLIHDPSIWILDEPLTGLDPTASFSLKQMMRQHADRGNTVLFSTHVLEVAEKLCDEIAIIDQGVLKYQGTLDHLRTQYPEKSLEAIFFEVTSHE